MIKNSIYTFHYFQPDDYRFSLDSVFLAQKVSQLIAEIPNLAKWKTLDLCAGCGIIGLELSLHRPELMNIDFLEIQNIYKSFFDKNVELISPNGDPNKFSFLNLNYQSLLQESFKDTYDLIISNPPYFFQGEGLLSPNEFKNRCRFFIDSDFKTLIDALYFSLKPEASAYLLVRKGNHHGRNPIQEMQQQLGSRALVKVIDEVRGTDIVQLFKKSF